MNVGGERDTIKELLNQHAASPACCSVWVKSYTDGVSTCRTTCKHKCVDDHMAWPDALAGGEGDRMVVLNL